MMKKLFISALFIAACLCGLPFAAQAQGYTPETVPNVQLADARQFVSNPDGILSAATVRKINGMCLELKSKGLAEVAVLVLNSVDESRLDMFAHNVLNLWGVGRKGVDNGLVISVVREQRDIQFETGYGLEGVLPDALCKRIQTVYMVPPLRENDWENGVLEGVRAVYNVLMDNKEELTALTEEHGEEGRGGLSDVLWVVFVLAVIILPVILRMIGRHKGGGGDGFGTGSFGGGMLGGGLFGGGFGGGGGGSFGGGRSGGGGARTGF